MAYKINIRNSGNTAWINLLESQYHEVLDANGKFAGTTVEAVLEELFDNKAQRVVFAGDPTNDNDDYQVGTIWVNSTADTVHICVDDTATAAVWLNVSSIDLEGIQDVVGGMFTGSSDLNIVSTYNDTTGKVDLSVATATATTLGVAMFPTTDFDVTAGSVTIADEAIAVQHLAANIDATGIGFDSDKVDGRDVNDAGQTTSDLWTASRITDYVDSVATGLFWQQPVIDLDVNDPPVAPAAGDRYVVSAGLPPATGDWAGHDNEIAEYDGSAWVFTPVEEGFAVWDEATDVQQVYNGTEWAKIGTTITHSNLVGIQGGNGGDELYHLTNAEHTELTGSKSANYVLAAPDGVSGTASFRPMISDDLPSLLSSKISDFTEAAQDATGALIAAGNQTNISVVYDDNTNRVDYTVATAGTTDGTPGVASFNGTQFTVNGNGHVSINGSSLDHGNLTGLADDDHLQYMHVDTARTVTAQHTYQPASAQAPFVLGSNAQGELVTGLNADLLNGQDWTVAATASAPSTPATNDIWIEITA